MAKAKEKIVKTSLQAQENLLVVLLRKIAQKAKELHHQEGSFNVYLNAEGKVSYSFIPLDFEQFFLTGNSIQEFMEQIKERYPQTDSCDECGKSEQCKAGEGISNCIPTKYINNEPL